MTETMSRSRRCCRIARDENEQEDADRGDGEEDPLEQDQRAHPVEQGSDRVGEDPVDALAERAGADGTGADDWAHDASSGWRWRSWATVSRFSCRHVSHDSSLSIHCSHSAVSGFGVKASCSSGHPAGRWSMQK